MDERNLKLICEALKTIQALMTEIFELKQENLELKRKLKMQPF